MGSPRKKPTGRVRQSKDRPRTLHDVTRSGPLFLKSVGRFAGRPWVKHMFTLRNQLLVSDDGQIVIPVADAQVFRPAHPKCVPHSCGPVPPSPTMTHRPTDLTHGVVGLFVVSQVR